MDAKSAATMCFKVLIRPKAQHRQNVAHDRQTLTKVSTSLRSNSPSPHACVCRQPHRVQENTSPRKPFSFPLMWKWLNIFSRASTFALTFHSSDHGGFLHDRIPSFLVVRTEFYSAEYLWCPIRCAALVFHCFISSSERQQYG